MTVLDTGLGTVL